MPASNHLHGAQKMKIRRIRGVIFGLSVICLLIVADRLQAQWGTNAPPCSNGPCVPPRGSFGYYKTCWRPWPCTMQSDSMQRPGSTIESVPPSNIELPPPGKEAEVRVPSPTRQPINRPLPGGSEPSLAPLPDRGAPNVPPRDELLPGGGPAGRSDINSLPMTVPGTDLPPEPMPPGGAQGATPQHASPRATGTLPRLKLRTTGTDNVAANSNLPIRGPRFASDEGNETTLQTSIKLRRPTTPSTAALGEPGLIMPHATKPLDATGTDAEVRSSTINPLRTGVIPTAHFDDETPPAATSSGDCVTGGSLNANPLRR